MAVVLLVAAGQANRIWSLAKQEGFPGEGSCHFSLDTAARTRPRLAWRLPCIHSLRRRAEHLQTFAFFSPPVCLCDFRATCPTSFPPAQFLCGQPAFLSSICRAGNEGTSRWTASSLKTQVIYFVCRQCSLVGEHKISWLNPPDVSSFIRKSSSFKYKHVQSLVKKRPITELQMLPSCHLWISEDGFRSWAFLEISRK